MTDSEFLRAGPHTAALDTCQRGQGLRLRPPERRKLDQRAACHPRAGGDVAAPAPVRPHD
jgi:hypothetical protein